MTVGFWRLTRKWPESVAITTLRIIDAVSHKKHRLSYKQINQCFLNYSIHFHSWKLSQPVTPPAKSSITSVTWPLRPGENS